MEMKFCRRCGTPVTTSGPEAYACSNHHTLFINAAPCVGVFFVDDDNNVLLSVRAIEPFKGTLDSFGGFINDQETAEDALERELNEELGLSPSDYDKPAFLCTETGVYPFDGEDRSVLSVFFWSKLKTNAKLTPTDDVAGVESLPIDNIDLARIHNVDVRKAIPKLQALFNRSL